MVNLERKTGIGLFLTLSLVASMAHAQHLTPPQIARIDSIIGARLAAHGAPAISVAVGRHEGVIWTAGYGLADLEHGVAATASTRYRTASISKWMTATAAMQLVEQEKLALDEPIRRYCPSFPAKRWPITVRHLLTHRAGVRHYVGANGEPRATPEQRTEVARRQHEERLGMTVRYTDVIQPLDRFKDDTLLFSPGQRFHYTSFGYRLLGCVLQGAAGQPYRELMHEGIFAPAGMEATRDDDALAVIPHRAAGYMKSPTGGVTNTAFRDVSENLPAGGHVSTAADLVRFALAWNTGRLVQAESRAAMVAKPRFPNAGAQDDFPPGRHYGFGVNVSDWAGRQVVWHTGGQNGTSTILILIPAEHLAVALMCNLEQLPDRLEIAYAIADVVLHPSAP